MENLEALLKEGTPAKLDADCLGEIQVKVQHVLLDSLQYIGENIAVGNNASAFEDLEQFKQLFHLYIAATKDELTLEALDYIDSL